MSVTVTEGRREGEKDKKLKSSAVKASDVKQCCRSCMHVLVCIPHPTNEVKSGAEDTHLCLQPRVAGGRCLCPSGLFLPV